MLPGPTVCQERTVKQEARLLLPPPPSVPVTAPLCGRRAACVRGGERAPDAVRRGASGDEQEIAA